MTPDVFPGAEPNMRPLEDTRDATRRIRPVLNGFDEACVQRPLLMADGIKVAGRNP